MPLLLHRCLLVALICAAVGLAGCDGETHFTSAPLPIDAEDAHISRNTNIFIETPLDAETLKLEIQSAITTDKVAVRDRVARAACRRGRCWTARVSGYVQPSNEISVAVGDDGVFDVAVPVAYGLNVRGLGAARRIRGVEKGRVVAHLRYAVAFDAGWRLALVSPAEPRLVPGKVDVLSGQMAIAGHVARAIAPAVEAARTSLEAALAGADMRAALQRAWPALHRPISLGSWLGDERWFSFAPTGVAPAGFHADGDRLAVRARVPGVLHVGDGRPPAVGGAIALAPMRAVAAAGDDEPATGAAAADGDADGGARGKPDNGSMAQLARTVVAVGRTLAITPFAERVKAQVLANPYVSGRVEPTAPLFAAKLTDAAVTGARHAVAIALTAEIIEPKRMEGTSGLIHLVGRIKLDQSRKMLLIEDVTFPAIGDPDAAVTELGTEIPIEPFAALLNGTSRIDLGAQLSIAARPQDRRIGVRVDDVLWLDGRFDAARVARVVPAANGLQAVAEFEGEFVIRARPARRESRLIGPGSGGAGASGVTDGLVDEIRKIARP